MADDHRPMTDDESEMYDRHLDPQDPPQAAQAPRAGLLAAIGTFLRAGASDDPTEAQEAEGTVYEVDPAQPEQGDGLRAPGVAQGPAPDRTKPADRPNLLPLDGYTRRLPVVATGVDVLPGTANVRRVVIVNTGTVDVDLAAGAAAEGAAWNGPTCFRLRAATAALPAERVEVTGTYPMRAFVATGGTGELCVLGELDPTIRA